MIEPQSDAEGTFVAVDVHYLDEATSRAAMVAACDQRFSVITSSRAAIVPAGAAYQPGEFYLRELPPLRAVIPASGELALILVDGYVDLDPSGRPGLGARVFAEFGVPVIGVAKTAFRTATHAAKVFRGQSSRPLYVTAAGMTVADAARLVTDMAGQFRVPDALKRADRLARGLDPPTPDRWGCAGLRTCQWPRANDHSEWEEGSSVSTSAGSEPTLPPASPCRARRPSV